MVHSHVLVVNMYNKTKDWLRLASKISALANVVSYYIYYSLTSACTYIHTSILDKCVLGHNIFAYTHCIIIYETYCMLWYNEPLGKFKGIVSCDELWLFRVLCHSAHVGWRVL